MPQATRPSLLAGMSEFEIERIRQRLRKHTEPDLDTGCVVWTGGRTARGYGRTALKLGGVWDRHVTVHRLAYELAFGPIPQGLLVRHAVCGRKLCCNPAHLAIGTHLDNARDDTETGRGRTKLTNRAVCEIWGFRLLGLEPRDIAGVQGVSTRYVQAILADAARTDALEDGADRHQPGAGAGAVYSGASAA